MPTDNTERISDIYDDDGGDREPVGRWAEMLIITIGGLFVIAAAIAAARIPFNY